MRDQLLVQHPVATARPMPAPAPTEPRPEIDWFKREAQTLDCSSDDIARWHWLKILAALDR